jgi:hypothetical protein
MISDHLDKSKIYLTKNRRYEESSENNPFVDIRFINDNDNECKFSFYLNDIETFSVKNNEKLKECNVFNLPIYKFAKELYEYYKTHKVKEGKFVDVQNDGNFKKKSKNGAKGKSKGKSKRKSKGKAKRKSKGKAKRQQRKSKKNQA